MRITILLVALTVTWGASVFGAAQAAGPADEEPCDHYPRLIAWLKSERGETLASRGDTGIGSFLEIHTNARTSSWSVVFVTTAIEDDGKRLSCIAMLGKRWRRYNRTSMAARPTGQTIKKMSDDPEENCDHYPRVIELLKSEHGETLAFRGERGTIGVLEIYTNPRTPSWSAVYANTLIGSSGKRLTCLTSFGQEWRRHK